MRSLIRLSPVLLRLLSVCYCLILSTNKERSNIKPEMRHKIPIMKIKQFPSNSTMARLVFLQEQLLKGSPFLSSQSFLQFPTDKPHVPLRNIENSLYIGLIEIGDPPKTIKVLLDTGSIYTWISSSRCDETCKYPSSYSRESSASFRLIPVKTDITYGNGQYYCEFNLEKMVIGGITIPQQFFGEIRHQEGDYLVNFDFEGLVGLAYPSMQINREYKPVFDSIIAQGVLPNSLMSFYLSVNEGEKGEMTLGYVDDSKYEGELKYYEVVDRYYWSIELSDIRMNGASLEFCDKDKCKAIIDTGSTLISGPSKRVKELLKSMPKQEDCSDNETGNSLTFVIGNDEYELLPQDYLMKYYKDSKVESSECKVLVEPLDLNNEHGPAWVLGEIFLQKYYVVFDRDTNRVGLAKAKHALNRTVFYRSNEEQEE